MSTQPEALRLADELEVRGFLGTTASNAAHELRRLHEMNHELLEALELAYKWLGEYVFQMRAYAVSDTAQRDHDVILAAIAKATGEKA